uniref:DUF4416 family protein n=1 Tax=candidate division WOR-3 bacterium TaxID=2052148 RepID=A0A7V3VTR5_UNCW3
MAEIKEPQKVLAFAGLIFIKDFDIELALKEFKRLAGSVIKKSEILPFIHTNYYNKEMGENLLRQWVLFEKLISPDLLVELKYKSNEVEKKFLNENGGRKINIDPGLVSLSNIILASTKNYSHRIYLGKGIYAEVTLIYKDHQFKTLEWTYPDYREEVALRFFDEARTVLKNFKIG